MKKHLLLFLAWAAALCYAAAQTAADVVVPITVSVNTSPPSIALSFPSQPTDTLTIIGRKLINQTQWQAIALPGNATTFTDVNVTPGVGYEYIVIKRGTGTPAQRIGLTYAGIEVLPALYRGRLILVVDDALSGPLAAELDRLVGDLRGDGWQVVRRDIDVATSTVPSVKALIRSEYESDPDNTVAVLLLGNIPVPYSGNIAPDGHPDHQGAWPTDYYYGDMDEDAWTDNTVNNTAAARPANRNVPGDGKFDQSQTPTLAELVVGRVDFSNLSGWDVPQVELYRRYFNKNHAFRTGAYNPARQTLVDDNFGYFGGEAFAQNGYRNGYAITGAASVSDLDFFNDTNNNSFLIGYGCGAGTYTSAAGVGTSANFQTDSVNIVFSMLFGSYFGDWDYETNPLMPSALASKGSILTCAWAGRPNWHLHHMALGEPILTSTYWVWLNSFLQFPVYPPNFGADLVHVGLLGDPTLRAHAVRPPQNLVATPQCGTIHLSWDASPDADLGYLVLWSEHPDSAYQLISPPVTGTSFVDSFPVDGQNYYMVRALRLEQVPSGSYYNPSVGVLANTLYSAVTPSISIEAANVSCAGENDGTATAVATGGSVFTYQWSTGANTATIDNLSPDIYTVVVTNEYGCTAEAEVLIEEPEPLSADATAVDASCADVADGSITVTALGGTPPYVFQWSNGASTADLSDLEAGTYTLTLTDANDCILTLEVQVDAPDPLEVQLTVADVVCAGASTGRIETSVNGGTPPYEYLWSTGSTSPTLEDVPAGDYTVVVSDANGCTIDVTATINEGAAIEVVGEVTDAGCAGAATGGIDLTVSGGSAPYTFAWSNGTSGQNLSGISAGTYTVTVTDANGCSREQSFAVNEASSLQLSLSTDPARCFGEANGTATVDVAGGTPPYSFLWSNGSTASTAENLASSTYTVTVTDAEGCTQSATATVGQPNALQGNAVWTALPCQQDVGNVSLAVTGGTLPYSFAWSNGATTQNLDNVPPGNYQVSITDASGCTTVIVATLEQPAPPLQSQIVFQQTSCPDVTPIVGTLSAAVLGGTSPYTFAWSNGASGSTQTNVPLGSYALTVTDAAGCTRVDTSIFYLLTPPWNVSAAATPTTCFGQSDGAISVSISGGQGLYTFLWSNGSMSQDLTGVGAGTYTLTITDVAGCTITVSATVEQPQPVDANVAISHVSCPGSSDGFISLGAVGGTPPYTYTWSNGAATPSISNLTAGVYTCTVSDANGCTAVFVQTVVAPVPPVVSLVGADSACVDTGLWVYRLVPGDLSDFRWSVSGGTIVSGQQTDAIVVDWTQAGQQTIVAAYTWGGAACPDTVAVQVAVRQCLIRTRELLLSDVQVIPNPFHAFLRVRFERPPQPGTWVRLSAVSGQLVLEQPLVDADLYLPTASLPAGTYLLQITEGGHTGVWRVVKTE